MTRREQIGLEQLTDLIARETERSGVVNGNVSCSASRGSSGDRPFTWRYSCLGNEAIEGGNDFDEPDPTPMVDRALSYLQATIQKNQKAKELQFESQKTSDSSGTFTFRGKTLVEKSHEQRYQDFLREAKLIYAPSRNFSENPETKTRLLIKYFPGRFGPNGVQSLEKKQYLAVQIGALFNALYESLAKQMKKSS